MKAGDVKKAQAAWIKSRKGWEAAEPITGEFFPKLDKAIDAWPDAKHGYHAIEAALFSGKLKEIAAPVDELVGNLAEFKKQLGAPSFAFKPQGLMNGATGLAYEVGENKSKGGESPYAGTSLIDMHENVEGIEAVWKLVFEDALKAKDKKLAHEIDEKIEDVEELVEVKDLKKVDQPALQKAAEELAVLMQSAAPKLGLKAPDLGG
ncbi:MAG: EfeM/EfeO family lipoprotein [Pseudolabrys sp.]